MKKMTKLISLILAAVITAGASGVTASADSLKKIDGIFYRCSDDGEQLGKYSGWAKGKKISEHLYARYYINDGVMLKNRWITVKGEKRYYMLSNGQAAIGNHVIGDRSYDFDGKGRLIKEDTGKFGIYTMAGNVTATGLTYTVGIDAPEGMENVYAEFYGNYIIERRVKDELWEEVGRDIYDGYIFPDSIYIIGGGGFDTPSVNISIKKFYTGALPAGEYRLKKTMSIEEDDGRTHKSYGGYNCFICFNIDETMSDTQ